jgi:AraC family transcriptional regulator
MNKNFTEKGFSEPEGPAFRTINEKKLIGKSMVMSLGNDSTFDLWSGFMPLRKEIKNKVGTDLFSLQIFDKSFDFVNFNPEAQFVKWAAVEVSDPSVISDGLKILVLESGLYAVFIHRGSSKEGERTFRYIFEKWLPSSEYAIDNRPHFEILGEKYRNDDPDSEEEVWIPVRPKNR